jgi:hypothetical protein
MPWRGVAVSGSGIQLLGDLVVDECIVGASPFPEARSRRRPPRATAPSAPVRHRGNDAPGRRFDSDCDHRPRGDLAPRRVPHPPRAGWATVRAADVSSVQRGSRSIAWSGSPHTTTSLAITALSGRSLRKEAPCLPRATSRERIFSTRIDPSKTPDRAGSRGQVSAGSWGFSPAKFRPVWTGRENAQAFPAGRAARARSEPAAPDASACQRWGRSEDADLGQQTIAIGRCRSLPPARPPRVHHRGA